MVVDSKSLDENNGLYHTDSADENGILIKNGGTLKLASSIINKTGDTATSGDDADFYGVNSAILVNTNGTLDISNVEINTKAVNRLKDKVQAMEASLLKCLVPEMVELHLMETVAASRQMKVLLKVQPKQQSAM